MTKTLRMTIKENAKNVDQFSMRKWPVLSFILLSFLSALLSSCSPLNVLRNPAQGVNETISQTSSDVFGIYTGSFDPPSNAHKKIMTQALDNYPIKKLLIFVNVSGSKDFKSSFAERRAMILGMLGLDADRVEVRPILRENVNETMEAINKMAKTIQFIGQDSFEALPPSSMLDTNRKWIVIPRGREPLYIPENANAEALAPIDDTSSSEIRALIVKNKANEANIDPFVRDYILEHRLYVPELGAAEKAKIAAFEKLFHEYKISLKRAMPVIDLNDAFLPTYLPDQSVSAWSDKFTNLIIKQRGLKGAEAENFRIFSHELLSKINVSSEIQKKIKRLKNINNPCTPSAMSVFF